MKTERELGHGDRVLIYVMNVIQELIDNGYGYSGGIELTERGKEILKQMKKDKWQPTETGANEL